MKYIGVGTAIRNTLAAWGIHEHAGCGCNEICTEMDSDGADAVEIKIEYYKQKMYESIVKWRREEKHSIPQPPLFTIELLIRYGIRKARQK